MQSAYSCAWVPSKVKSSADACGAPMRSATRAAAEASRASRVVRMAFIEGGHHNGRVHPAPRPIARHPMATAPALFCFGLGYCAIALADALRRDGWQVGGTCRTAEAQAELARRGISAHLFERGRPLADPSAVLAGATHVLTSVPPDAGGDPVLDLHGADLARLPGVR